MSDVIAMQTNITENACNQKCYLFISCMGKNKDSRKTYKTLVFERIMNGAQQQPKRPQKFEPELEHKVGRDHDRPQQQEAHVHQCVAEIRTSNKYFMITYTQWFTTVYTLTFRTCCL